MFSLQPRSTSLLNGLSSHNAYNARQLSAAWDTDHTCEYHTHTHTQPFYGSVEFVRENPGEPVPEEHSPTTLIVVINHPYQLSPSSTIHGILPIQSTCSTVFFHNLYPSFLWSTSWPGTLTCEYHTNTNTKLICNVSISPSQKIFTMQWICAVLTSYLHNV